LAEADRRCRAATWPVALRFASARRKSRSPADVHADPSEIAIDHSRKVASYGRPIKTQQVDVLIAEFSRTSNRERPSTIVERQAGTEREPTHLPDAMSAIGSSGNMHATPVGP
jgi:hypothetical protein